MTLNQHVLEETLEALVMGRLQTVESERVEDHLLGCEKCRLQFEEIEAFVTAIKTASGRIREARIVKAAPTPSWQRVLGPIASYPLWVVASVLILVALIALPVGREQPVTYRELLLTTMRGDESAIAGSSNVRLRLKLDLSGLPLTERMQVTIVDATGNAVFTSLLPAGNASFRGVEIPQRLVTGFYWVRLFDAADGQLLREYPLEVQ
jgi:hypothetical protein